MIQIGRGIVSWDGYERRSRRYGSITLDREDFSRSICVDAALDAAALATLNGRRVRIVATVVEDRDSGHEGDPFIKMKPSRPARGEVIEVGVGTLGIELCGWSATGVAIVLRPSDGREKAWIDPRVLYRLHDQTVELAIEATDAPESPRTTLTFAPPGVISDGDGGAWVSGSAYAAAEAITIAPTITRIGEGTFLVERTVAPAGEYLPARPIPPGNR